MKLARKSASASYCAIMIDATGVGLLVLEDSMHSSALGEFDSDTTPFLYVIQPLSTMNQSAWIL